MEQFNLKIIGPSKTDFDGAVVFLSAKTPAGEVGILAHHARFISTLAPGTIQYSLPDSSLKTFEIDGGFLKVFDNRASVVYF